MSYFTGSICQQAVTKRMFVQKKLFAWAKTRRRIRKTERREAKRPTGNSGRPDHTKATPTATASV